MTTYWNDLAVLKDISKQIEESAIEDVNFDDNDISDFKESVQYFIDDWINANIKLYKDYHFEQIMYDSLYDVILNNYGFMIDDLHFDLLFHTLTKTKGIEHQTPTNWHTELYDTAIKAMNEWRVYRLEPQLDFAFISHG